MTRTSIFRFKSKATDISGLLKDRRQTSLQEIIDWIEYVLRHGGARHLRAEVFNIPWYQYYLLDVMVFLVAIVTLVVTVIRLICRCLCRVCCRKGDTKPKAEWNWKEISVPIIPQKSCCGFFHYSLPVVFLVLRII